MPFDVRQLVSRCLMLDSGLWNRVPQGPHPRSGLQNLSIQSHAGDQSVGATLVPIPNTIVKPYSADGTPLARARESRPSPAPLCKTPDRSWSGVLCFYSPAPASHPPTHSPAGPSASLQRGTHRRHQDRLSTVSDRLIRRVRTEFGSRASRSS